MKTKAAFLLILFAVSVGYSVFCGVSGHILQPTHVAFCASFHPHEYLAHSVLPLFLLLLTGSLMLLPYIFTPSQFVYALYKPPQRS